MELLPVDVKYDNNLFRQSARPLSPRVKLTIRCRTKPVGSASFWSYWRHLDIKHEWYQTDWGIFPTLLDLWDSCDLGETVYPEWAKLRDKIAEMLPRYGRMIEIVYCGGSTFWEINLHGHNGTIYMKNYLERSQGFRPQASILISMCDNLLKWLRREVSEARLQETTL